MHPETTMDPSVSLPGGMIQFGGYNPIYVTESEELGRAADRTVNYPDDHIYWMKTFSEDLWSVSVFDLRIDDGPSIYDSSRSGQFAVVDTGASQFWLPTQEYN